jgi:hypothetical protein
MYFVKMLTDVSLRTFNLTVWADNQGAPGTVLYQSGPVKPQYRNWLNTFWFYKLDTPLLVDAGQTIYIGWVQNTSSLLNIGLDCNTDSKEHVFFNTNGNWYSSLIPGSLMIRPAFGGPVAADINVGSEESLVQSDVFDLKLYPNPTSHVLHFQFGAQQELANLRISVFNVFGQSICHSLPIEASMDVSTWPNGIYVAHVMDTKSGAVQIKKFSILK